MTETEFRQKVLDGVESQGKTIQDCEKEMQSLKTNINSQASEIAALKRRGLGAMTTSPAKKVEGQVKGAKDDSGAEETKLKEAEAEMDKLLKEKTESG